ncbi:MAG: phosphatidate cytidylyltransferase [Clostridia bacterium]|nr:phosphatidate cytidylyltransferase [Clostridia bacterium]
MLKRLFIGLGLMAVVIICFAVSTETALLLVVAFALVSCYEIGDTLQKLNRNVVKWIPMALVVGSTLMIYFKLDLLFIAALFIVLIVATFVVCMKSKKRTAQDALMTLGTLLYPGISFVSIVYICSLPFSEWFAVFITGFVGAVGCDTFAYFGGKFFGKHKLAPVLSPKKTIEGSISGSVGATIAAIVFWYFSRNIVACGVWEVIIVAFVCSIISQIGDLSASYIKREAGIKDFGNLIPAHGGAMDRLDSLLFAIPAAYVILKLFERF